MKTKKLEKSIKKIRKISKKKRNGRRKNYWFLREYYYKPYTFLKIIKFIVETSKLKLIFSTFDMQNMLGEWNFPRDPPLQLQPTNNNILGHVLHRMFDLVAPTPVSSLSLVPKSTALIDHFFSASYSPSSIS